MRLASSARRAPEHAGTVDQGWPETHEECNGLAVRQVPGGDWDEQTWISADGRVAVRAFDPFDREWRWGAWRNTHVDEAGELTVDVHCGRRRARVRVVRAIALAWVGCPHHLLHPHASLLQQPGDVEASNIGWREAGATRSVRREPDEPAPEDPPPRTGWRPTRAVWRAANGDVLHCFGARADEADYEAHPSGWVRSRIHGGASRGQRDPFGDHWIALRGCGLIRVADLVAATFERQPPRNAAAGAQPFGNSARLPHTAAFVAGSASFDEWVEAEGVRRGTAWNWLVQFARDAPWTQARGAWRLLPRTLRTHVESGAFRQTARDALVAVRAQLPHNHTFHLATEEDAYAMLSLARALARRDRLREGCVESMAEAARGARGARGAAGSREKNTAPEE